MISEKERLQALQVIKAIRENDNGKVTSFIKKGWAKLLYNHKTYLQIEPKKAGIPNAIETALFNSNFDILKKMKKDGLNFDEFELLRTCCQCNDSYNEANFLIKNGANINFAKQNSSPPLYTAVVNNRDDLVKLFIQNDADLDMAYETNNTYCVLGKKRTEHNISYPLFSANYQNAKMLLDNGADPKKTNHDGKSAFECNINKNAKNIIKKYLNGDKKPSFSLLSGDMKKKKLNEQKESLDIIKKPKKIPLKDILKSKSRNI